MLHLWNNRFIHYYLSRIDDRWFHSHKTLRRGDAVAQWLQSRSFVLKVADSNFNRYIMPSYQHVPPLSTLTILTFLNGSRQGMAWTLLITDSSIRNCYHTSSLQCWLARYKICWYLVRSIFYYAFLQPLVYFRFVVVCWRLITWRRRRQECNLSQDFDYTAWAGLAGGIDKLTIL